MMKKKVAEATENELAEQKDKMKTLFFVLRTDENRYKDLLNDLRMLISY